MEAAPVAQAVEVGADPVEALPVAEQHARLAVGEAELHLGAGPPGVHADDRRPDADRGPVADDPLGVVAHGDRHPVAVADADRGQVGGEGADPLVDVGVRVPLVLVDEEVLVGVGGRGGPEQRQVGWGGVVGPRRQPVTLDNRPQASPIAPPGEKGTGLPSIAT